MTSTTSGRMKKIDCFFGIIDRFFLKYAKKERLPRMILKIILRQPLFVSRPCRYRPYPKAGRTVRLRLFALGKPFLMGMPDRIPMGIWKANARLHVLTAFDRPWGIICRLPNRGTV